MTISCCCRCFRCRGGLSFTCPARALPSGAQARRPRSVAAAGRSPVPRAAPLSPAGRLRHRCPPALHRRPALPADARADASAWLLGFRQRGLVRPCRLDAAPAQRADGFRSAGDAAAAVELGDPLLGVGDLALESGDLGREQRPRRRCGVTIGLERGDGLRLRPARDRCARRRAPRSHAPRDRRSAP